MGPLGEVRTFNQIEYISSICDTTWLMDETKEKLTKKLGIERIRFDGSLTEGNKMVISPGREVVKTDTKYVQRPRSLPVRIDRDPKKTQPRKTSEMNTYLRTEDHGQWNVILQIRWPSETTRGLKTPTGCCLCCCGAPCASDWSYKHGYCDASCPRELTWSLHFAIQTPLQQIKWLYLCSLHWIF